MKTISIKPVWTIQHEDGQTLPPRLVELLSKVHALGSLQAASQDLGLSYRHAWDLVRQGESQFGATLLHMERGRGSRLSALGEKLVWADHRVAARLSPALESLASELATELTRVDAVEPVVLRVHASHGFAIELLLDELARDGLPLERRYCSSIEAAAALRDRACDLAGFHIPLGAAQAPALRHYARWLDRADQWVIDVATRRQGLMVSPGNPRKIYDVGDLARPEVRFINRQAGSGTRFLLETLLEERGLAPDRIVGYEQGEFTHAAVAAHVASGMADAGFGVETPARRFRLDFVPLAQERYFLLCNSKTLETPAVQRLLEVLRRPAVHRAIDELPGYEATRAGQVTPLEQAFSWP